ncbi:MAG: tannase/feruloyl esterase family alpha/beta hydrolase [Acidobacteria bacterium]|nr:tannase/feruloyl esterase family alpha/beta hydrolase [Acidobacteriota bacterium]
MGFSKVLLLGSLLLAFLVESPVSFSDVVCQKASSLHLPDIQIVSVGEVSPNSAATFRELSPALLQGLPAFCRVQAVARPASDSEIHIEVWIPIANWNRRFWGVGNGGFGGSIDLYSMANLVGRGFATAGTDTGHSLPSSNATWALGHPQKIEDFGWRAIHLMTITAKAVVAAVTDQSPAKSYFGSCSTGGRQALMEVQRFPGDYDGVLAGAPANDWTSLLAMGASDMKAFDSEPDSYISPEDLTVIHDAVERACHATNGVVADPTRCSFNPRELVCSQNRSTGCLNKDQVGFLKRLYQGLPRPPDSPAFPGYEPGGELGPGGWSTWLTGRSPGASLMAVFVRGYYANFVYDDSNWQIRDFNLRSASALSKRGSEQALNATATDLAAFRDRGGKLIIYHGWSDPAIPPLSSVRYFNGVIRTMGVSDTESFLRLYMVPGMQHCAGGPGADSFGQEDPSFPPTDASRDIASSLVKWVEEGKSPESLIATKYDNSEGKSRPVKFTQLLCPYPLAARYTRTGEKGNATSYVCSSSH